MLLPANYFAIGAIILASSLTNALSPSDIPADTPVSQLIKSANAQLAAGNAQNALTYFDVAVSRDPQNYLNIFKRGAAYLSLGKSLQARRDFDRVLALKPGFEGALVQRAKLRARNGEWAGARTDYEAAGRKDGLEIAELEEAQGAATLAEEAVKAANWDECVQQAGVAIMVAGTQPDLRRLRARCRFEKGEVAEGVSDLHHLLQISSGSTEPYMQISAMTFYSLGESEKGLAQVRKCLQSDPDSKSCRQLMRHEKALDKNLRKLFDAMERRQFSIAVKLLTGSSGEPGLLQEVKHDTKKFKDDGFIHVNSPNGLYASLVEMTCEAYIEVCTGSVLDWIVASISDRLQMNNHKHAQQYCAEALQLNPHSLHGLLAKAKQQLDADDFEPAIHTLKEAKEHHGGNKKIDQMMNEAQTLLHRSKQKDYYKVLGVTRDADEREIKKAYRSLTKKYHPDKATMQGISKEEAEKKMASINEAYEVLSDPELKARFDRGDDPNDPHQGSPFQGSPFGQGAGGQQFFFKTGKTHPNPPPILEHKIPNLVASSGYGDQDG
jgi:DnaJ family protein C protein 3